MVTDEPTLLDHAMIGIELRVDSQTNPQFIRNPRNTNWESVLMQELERTLTNFSKAIKSISTLEDIAQLLTRK